MAGPPPTSLRKMKKRSCPAQNGARVERNHRSSRRTVGSLAGISRVTCWGSPRRWEPPCGLARLVRRAEPETIAHLPGSVARSWTGQTLADHSRPASTRTMTNPNASISGHPASPSCEGTSTPHRPQIRMASNISASFPRPCLPRPCVPLPERA